MKILINEGQLRKLLRGEVVRIGSVVLPTPISLALDDIGIERTVQIANQAKTDIYADEFVRAKTDE